MVRGGGWESRHVGSGESRDGIAWPLATESVEMQESRPILNVS